ncbi:MAG: hypothetical protein RhofKO_25680 [Rhodothermales bacterium]
MADFVNRHSYLYADLEDVSLSCSKGLGVSRLKFVLKVYFRPKLRPEEQNRFVPPTALESMTADVYLLGDGSKEGVLLGKAYAEVGRRWHQERRLNKCQMTLHLDISPHQIEAIEEVRDGSDINFRLDIFAIERPFVEYNDQQGNAVEYVGLAGQAHVSRRVPIEQSKWLKILDALGYQKTIIYELQSPNESAGKHLADAVALFRKAQASYQRADYDEAIAQVRACFEQLEVYLKDGKSLPGSLKAVASCGGQKASEIPKDQRFQALRRLLYSISSLAGHKDPLGFGTSWDRYDAKAVLGITVSILNREIQRGG